MLQVLNMDVEGKVDEALTGLQKKAQSSAGGRVVTTKVRTVAASTPSHAIRPADNPCVPSHHTMTRKHPYSFMRAVSCVFRCFPLRLLSCASQKTMTKKEREDFVINLAREGWLHRMDGRRETFGIGVSERDRT